ncbi:YdcH family protein [Methylopila henanensis]|uniref:YdcH family protein n=1 Tax=Methylopila henanensis TaxID=873516 RepID=A0ABW4K4L6_9HYPH
MSIESHLVELEKKHRAIEREIELELAHPNTDDVKVTTLKRKKLRIKDEIVRLAPTGATVH